MLEKSQINEYSDLCFHVVISTYRLIEEDVFTENNPSESMQLCKDA